ncbi:MAG: anthranilate phosphoribosyltransferase [Acidobacteria bacterium]|nr:MAG: anthranilate phosphoribosyltransferase [Acidobacteriota bacterium]
MREALERLVAGQHLTRAEARKLLAAILAGPEFETERAGHDMSVAAILTALAAKGETVDEMAGFAEAMRGAMVDIGLNGQPRHWVDTCGTGGNARKVFNVSTAAALVAAASGQAIAKHGNRTSTSICGSADILEALGVRLDFPAERLGACLREIGIAFLFAPLLHPATRQVMPARRALGIQTIFNALGPLTNPAGAESQVVGVSSISLLEKMAEALQLLGTRHSFVVRSRDGIGELSTTDINDVAEIEHGVIRRYTLNARELGLPRADFATLHCQSKEEAVSVMRRVLAGESGPLQDIVCLNAAAALVAGGTASDLRDGLKRARMALVDGAAQRKLEMLVAYTQH